ncbi:hypothetical protein AHAT_06700 [Agarivorans sp. Toyoura001]|uniref:pentapeptide repeat-containing protein n=1 Tax=Agarivorans sp. Toyoura001 TaxID=2283141 RepID=UPI0010EEB09E|nr:hypothetical protein [Agarivorans sp. Toyoura001]GDY24780.1 hypothetical protein AHAT_06700 [Agarivorans sp. Toyoura001]
MLIIWLKKAWDWVSSHHGVLSSAATIIAVVLAYVSLKSSADNFTRQLDEQKRAAQVANVAYFVSAVSDAIVLSNTDEARLERFIVSRSQLLFESLNYPSLVAQVIQFLASNELTYLFDTTRSFVSKKSLSLAGKDLSGVELKDITFQTTTLYCVNLENSYLAKVAFDMPESSYVNFRNVNFSQSLFHGARAYWGNFKDVSIELSGTKDERADTFSRSSFIFSNLSGLRINKSNSQAESLTVNELKAQRQVELGQLSEMLFKTNTLYGSVIDDDLRQYMSQKDTEQFKRLVDLEHLLVLDSVAKADLVQRRKDYREQAKKVALEHSWKKAWEAKLKRWCEK